MITMMAVVVVVVSVTLFVSGHCMQAKPPNFGFASIDYAHYFLPTIELS